MGIVFKDSDGRFAIGPLSEEQYKVILDSLELAAAWAGRNVSTVIARTLAELIPSPELVNVNAEHFTSNPDKLSNQLPSVQELEDGND